MGFSPETSSSNDSSFERWYVRNYGTPVEQEKYGFQKRGTFSFNLLEIGFALVSMYSIYRFFF